MPFARRDVGGEVHCIVRRARFDVVLEMYVQVAQPPRGAASFASGGVPPSSYVQTICQPRSFWHALCFVAAMGEWRGRP